MAGALSLASCDEWLDVSPNTDLPAKELFTTENGFKSALAGLYITMTEENTAIWSLSQKTPSMSGTFSSSARMPMYPLWCVKSPNENDNYIFLERGK